MTAQIEKEPLVYPIYYYVVERDAQVGAWKFKKGESFYNPSEKDINYEEKERYFGLTKPKIATELFRINGGKSGWYLVNMRDRQYYYCGLTRESVKEKLRFLLN